MGIRWLLVVGMVAMCGCSGTAVDIVVLPEPIADTATPSVVVDGGVETEVSLDAGAGSVARVDGDAEAVRLDAAFAPDVEDAGPPDPMLPTGDSGYWITHSSYPALAPDAGTCYVTGPLSPNPAMWSPIPVTCCISNVPGWGCPCGTDPVTGYFPGCSAATPESTCADLTEAYVSGVCAPHVSYPTRYM